MPHIIDTGAAHALDFTEVVARLEERGIDLGNDGRMGEALKLRFVERSSLSAGKVQLYRARRDIHRQLPPEQLSISLNIMEEGEHVPWRDQAIVDLRHGIITKRPTLTPAERLMRCAVHFCDEDVDLADQFARHHPVPRVRDDCARWLALAQAP